jgi:CHAT domain-containing protein
LGITALAGLVCVILLTTCLAHTGLFVPGLSEARGLTIATQDARDLGPGAAIEREISGGETHSYRIALIEGQYLRALVKGQDINLLVTLQDPGGEKVFERSRNHRLRSELVLALARQSGDHYLTVSARGQQGLRGRYTVNLEELRNALPEDHQRVAGERLLAEGEQLRSQRKAESYAQALKKFEESLTNWRSIGDRLGEAQALSSMGLIHRALGDTRKALDCYHQALPLFRAGGDRLGEAETLTNMAVAHQALGELKTALDFSNQALPLLRELGDRQGEVSTLNNIGSAYWASGDGPLALDYYNQTLPLRRELRDLAGEARTINNIGTVYSDMGEPHEALASYLQALTLRRQANDRSGEATTLSNIGLIYHGLGESLAALDYNEQAIPLRQAAGDRRGLAYTFRNIALAHSGLGDEQKALDYNQQALTIFREVGDKRGEAQTLSLLGWIYNGLGNYQKALDCLSQALPVSRMVGDRRGEAMVHESLGELYIEWTASRDLDKSLDHYRQALAIQKAVRSPQDVSRSLLGIARVERERGNFTIARASIEEALRIIESLRARIAVQDLRASYLATNQDFYEFYIDLLMSMSRSHSSENSSAGYEAEAFEANERRLARSLLESLTEANPGAQYPHQGVDPRLLADERALRQRLNSKETYRIQLLAGKHTQEQAAAVEKELNDLLAQYQNVQARIRSANPRQAALINAEPLNLREIQRQVLDDDTLLLEYALGEERGFLWAVARNSIASFELPGREVIETAAQRAYQLLNVSHKRQHRRESELAAAELGRIVIGPVAGILGRKRLLIVADGVLQYVPFAVLPEPQSGRAGERESGRSEDNPQSANRNPQSYTPLIVNHEIINLPSASTLAALRQEFAGRRPAPKTVAVLADPVLQADDARVKEAVVAVKKEIAGSAETVDLGRSARASGVPNLERLPFTRREAETILALARDGKSLKALDFNASRAIATSPELAEYRIVHFATHGLINSQRPQLSGIVLSLVDERGRSQEGFLRAHDIYNLRLGADLVVLSACQTALGKRIKGEGLVGLARGFMCAGSPRVAASLWNVKDEATAELMNRFYQKMLREGAPAAAALRAAQISMWKDKRWEAPYYWAGFVLQGEWR